MLSKLLAGILVAVLGLGYVYYTTTQAKLEEQMKLLAAQELREQEQEKTITALQDNLQKTSEALGAMTTRNSEIEAEQARYLDIFRRHNLTKLAAAKPTLIQDRINKGTKDVFDSIENDSRIIDGDTN